MSVAGRMSVAPGGALSASQQSSQEGNERAGLGIGHARRSLAPSRVVSQEGQGGMRESLTNSAGRGDAGTYARGQSVGGRGNMMG
jgi:hypothetical protein